jgi:hypothetical protein
MVVKFLLFINIINSKNIKFWALTAPACNQPALHIGAWLCSLRISIFNATFLWSSDRARIHFQARHRILISKTECDKKDLRVESLDKKTDQLQILVLEIGSSVLDIAADFARYRTYRDAHHTWCSRDRDPPERNSGYLFYYFGLCKWESMYFYLM